MIGWSRVSGEISRVMRVFIGKSTGNQATKFKPEAIAYNLKPVVLNIKTSVCNHVTA